MAVKKGIFFTIDSLLASGIVILTVLLVSTFYINEHKKVNVSYASQDLVRVFSTLKIGEVDNEYVASLISSGEITNVNYTIIEQIGDFWAQDRMDLAQKIAINLTHDLIPAAYGFSLLIDEEEIYSRNVQLRKALVSSRKLVTGITKAQPTDGFSARVLLQGIKSKKTNAYVYFGGYEGDGNLTKKLTLPNDVTSFESAYLEVDAGGNFTLYINGFESGDFVKGSAGGGSLLADKWNLTSKNLTFFKAGENTVTLNFTSDQSYIAGGFLKVKYETSSFNGTEVPGYEKNLLPGIDGLINLYSSVYFPSNLTNMSVYLHFKSSNPLYLTIGNSTVFEYGGSNQIVEFTLNSSNLSESMKSSALSYDFLKGKTVPFRLGLSSGILAVGGADSILITDRTNSMSKCDVPASCSLSGLCDTNPNGGCHMRRIDAAADSDRKYIEIMLNETKKNNKVGLVGFGFDTNPVCDIRDFSQDNSSLANWTTYYKRNAWCGNTCISCGVYSATQMLTENEKLHGFNKITFNEPKEYKLGVSNFNSVTVYVNTTFNPSNIVKARLSIFGDKVDVDSGRQDCIYFNNRYIGRMCETKGVKLSYHTCQYVIKPEWFNTDDLSKNNITVTAGTNSNCFGGAGTEDNWNLTDITLIAWEADEPPSIIFNSTYDNAQYADGIELSKTQITNSTTFNISNVVYIEENKTKIKSAWLEFEAANGSLDNFNCVYVNGNFIGRVDAQEWNSTNNNKWQKVMFDVPDIFLRNGTNEVNLTSGTSQNCKGSTGNTHDKWRFRNLSLTVLWSDANSKYNRHKSMLVMSDGIATEVLDRRNAQYAEARDEVVDKACEAHNLFNISIYTVAMGDAADAPTQMMQDAACCDNCSHYYRAESLDELLNVYGEIAALLSNVAFEEGSQTAFSGSFFERTSLFPDSFIDFNYTLPDFEFNRLPLVFETNRFGNDISSGPLTIYQNTTFSEGKVTSYSSSMWTDKVLVNGTLTFDLGIYGNYSSNDPTMTKVYRNIGDPFTVNIPASMIDEGIYNITVSTGTNSSNPTNGSADNMVIYTLLLNTFTDYSPVVAESDGCSWTVEFQDGTSSLIDIPLGYNGPDTCSFTAALKKYSSNDSVETVVFQLFKNLDIDKDGRLDVNIDASSLEVNTLTISKVPSLWGPAVVEISVWE